MAFEKILKMVLSTKTSNIKNSGLLRDPVEGRGSKIANKDKSNSNFNLILIQS